ncbi:sensor histidine kinase [Isoptericola cucumis]|uniref:histidine kinase n=1 Tax=Isoptericola cucumis TaxID=1776856 RepID=A0ABQ2B1G3_9MICO|nr:HAMP domain-containing sensor histidine kinase [Isoptericola cucumis]GGI05596.1 two-component sensor histidine kinase [Isoptericola cucumis]
MSALPPPGTPEEPVTEASATGKPVSDDARPGWLQRVPLRTRLVAVTVLLLTAGLILAAAVTRTVVSDYLVRQVDQQLKQSATAVANITFRAPDSPSPQIPTDYAVTIRDANGVGRTIAWPQTEELLGTPNIPRETLDEVSAHEGEPFTVSSTGGQDDAQWRVVPFVYTSGGEPVGSAYVSLPLVGVDETISFLTRSLMISSLGIVLLGGGTALLLVHRSLRPLRRIEATAAEIADGDLSQRVPDLPPTTEVGSLSRSLNTMLAHIERAFSAQEESERRMRRFVSDASHELRTPLATVKGYGELYRMGALDTPAKVDDTMGRIEDSARRMSTLVNDLLVLARLDEGRPLRREEVDLAAMARDAVQDLHALDPSREVAVVGLHDGAPPTAVPATGDPDRLRQVLTNLVGNVARHTPAGSPAELAVGTAPDGGAVVEVRDHGPGIAPEQAARIFERFYRADSSRNRTSGGSGLGMAIVAAIVGAHDGHVSVADTPGGGLTVRVALPPVVVT